jgi:hypothetical protein
MPGMRRSTGRRAPGAPGTPPVLLGLLLPVVRPFLLPVAQAGRACGWSWRLPEKASTAAFLSAETRVSEGASGEISKTRRKREGVRCLPVMTFVRTDRVEGFPSERAESKAWSLGRGGLRLVDISGHVACHLARDRLPAEARPPPGRPWQMGLACPDRSGTERPADLLAR